MHPIPEFKQSVDNRCQVWVDLINVRLIWARDDACDKHIFRIIAFFDWEIDAD